MSVNNNFLKLAVGIIFFVIFILTLLFLQQNLSQDLSAPESEALYGGRLETGYGSAGFLFSIIDSKLTTCGLVALNPQTALTAAHCVNTGALPRAGLGFFTTDQSKTVAVNLAVIKSGWADLNLRSSDLALIQVERPIFLEQAGIISPTESCDYMVVAYGRTENLAERGTFPRKSAQVCVSNISQDLFQVRADASNPAGVCFGDSGSPIFLQGTNQVVGLIVSIQRDSRRGSDAQCDFGNIAYAIRLDSNFELISQNLANVDVEDIDVEFVSSIADISEKDVINEDLDEQVIVMIGITVVVVLVLVGLVILVRRR